MKTTLERRVRVMNSIDLKNITVLGELGHRLLRNSMRLESEMYQPNAVYQQEDCEWPADWEGRTLLALIRQMEATHREPSYLREILCGVYARLNQKGYLNRILPDGYYDEQQLSGHNWLLRALLEYYRLTGCNRAKEVAQTMVTNLYLPLRGAYKLYPVNPEDRVFEGNPDGCLTGDCINGWYLSTDIGCAYMSLDGLSQAYQMFPSPELAELLEEMICEFVKIDFVGISMQTHATLSGIRGILRYHAATGDPKYLENARRLFELYLKEGMSENYANHNWFGRPLWTEPCAIVDSFMAAMELYRQTDEIFYFEKAQKIYLNAFSHAQRQNGGFGCDNCVGANTPFLTVHGNGGDAYWCCTMRGGEGLTEVARSIFLEKEGVLHIGMYHNAEWRQDGCRLEMTTQYPLKGYAELRLNGRLPQDKLALYLPSYAPQCQVSVNESVFDAKSENGFVTIDVPENAVITINFDIPLQIVPVKHHASLSGYVTVNHGWAMLGVETAREKLIDLDELSMSAPGVYRTSEVELKQISQTYQVEMSALTDRKLQVLFRK